MPAARGPGRWRRSPRAASRRPSPPGPPPATRSAVDPLAAAAAAAVAGRRRCRGSGGWRARSRPPSCSRPTGPARRWSLAAAIPAALLVRGTGRAWSLPAAAPLLGLATLAPRLPGAGGPRRSARSSARRSAPPGCGGWCSRRRLLDRSLAARAPEPPTAWSRHAGLTLDEVLAPPFATGLVAVAAVWAVAALILPWMVRGRYAGPDFVGASAWAAGLGAGTAAVAEWAGATNPRGLVAGAVAAGVARLAAAAPAPAGYRGDYDPREIRSSFYCHERPAQPGIQAGRPRRGHVLARLQVRGAPGGDRAQAHARDGGAQGPVAVARLRAQRVRRLALARRPQAVRGLRGRPRDRAVGLPARARPPRADRARDRAEDQLPHRRPPAPRRVRHPGPARAARRGRRRRRPSQGDEGHTMVYTASERLAEPLREPDHRRGSARLRYEGRTTVLALERRRDRPLARLRRRARGPERLPPPRRGPAQRRLLDRRATSAPPTASRSTAAASKAPSRSSAATRSSSAPRA